jgi:hypothetical protein
MQIQRTGWLLSVSVASGWLLLVTGIGILLTPHHPALAHGPGKIAATCVFIAAVSWLSAQTSRLPSKTPISNPTPNQNTSRIPNRQRSA